MNLRNGLKKGDVIDLDCGYCGMDDTRPCRLLEDPRKCVALFDGVQWVAKVEILGIGETFTAVLPSSLFYGEQV